MHQVESRHEAFLVLTELNFVVSRPNGRTRQGDITIGGQLLQGKDL